MGTLVNIIFGNRGHLAGASRHSSDIGQSELAKYYYYITHGVETENVAALEDHWLDNMFNLVDQSLMHHEKIVEQLKDDVKEEYLLSVKKAIVDFTLKLEDDSRDKLKMLKNYEQASILGSSASNKNESDRVKERIFYDLKAELESALSVVPKPWNGNFVNTRKYIGKRLHNITPVVAQILSLWHTSFADLRLVDAQDVLERNEALELQVFHRLMMGHIDQAKDKLLNKWFKEVIRIFSSENKKLHQEGFLDCTAELMTQQLQDLAINSIHDYKHIFVNKADAIRKYQHPGFILRLQLDVDHIAFSPSFNTIEEVLTSFVDTIVQAVMNIPRIETKMYTDFKASKQYLEPFIPKYIIEGAKEEIRAILKSETSAPINYMTNYDPYMSLITNEAEAEINECLEVKGPEGSQENLNESFQSGQSAEQQQQNNDPNAAPLSTGLDFDIIMKSVQKYQDMNDEIMNNLEKVCRVGMFDIKSDEFSHSMSKRADKHVTTLLGKAQEEHLASMKSIQVDYEQIARKAVKTPANTEELVELKEYMGQIKMDVMPNMRSKLLKGQKHMTALFEQRTFVNSMMTPRDLSINSEAFTWHQRMPAIFQENEEIIRQREQQYQDALTLKKERFIEELETYQQKLDEFEGFNSADPSDVNRYLKSTQKLNNQLDQALKKIEQFNIEEESYGLEITSYPQQKEIQKQVQPSH